METYEVLEQALALIEDERQWCQGAVRKGGARCAIGALNFVAAGVDQGGVSAKDLGVAREVRLAYRGAVDAVDRLAERDGFAPHPCLNGNQPAIANFNNNRTHAEVVALFQEAIRQEKEKAGVLVEVPAEAPQEVPA